VYGFNHLCRSAKAISSARPIRPSEDFTLDFWTEIFNLTNTPPLTAPDAVFGRRRLRDYYFGRRSQSDSANIETESL